MTCDMSSGDIKSHCTIPYQLFVIFHVACCRSILLETSVRTVQVGIGISVSVVTVGISIKVWVRVYHHFSNLICSSIQVKFVVTLDTG